jgi:hypothetical protein
VVVVDVQQTALKTFVIHKSSNTNIGKRPRFFQQVYRFENAYYLVALIRHVMCKSSVYNILKVIMRPVVFPTNHRFRATADILYELII